MLKVQAAFLPTVEVENMSFSATFDLVHLLFFS